VLQNQRSPSLNPSRGPHGGERAPCDNETPYIGEKGPHEAKGTMELKGPIKAKKPTTVKGPTERMNHTCLRLLRGSWYSFTDPGGIEG